MTKIGDQLGSKIKILNLVYLKCLELIKYNIEHTIADYIELSVSIALTSGLGNKIVTYLENDKFLNLSKLKKEDSVEKFSQIVDEYVGQTMATKILLKKYKIVSSLGFEQKIAIIIDDLKKLPKDLRNADVISILKVGGTVDDSGLIGLGGFLETKKTEYPLNQYSLHDRLGEKDYREKTHKYWMEKVESYFEPIISKIEDYLVRRAKYNNFVDPDGKKIKNDSFDSVAEVVEKIKRQDKNILEYKLDESPKLTPQEIEENMEIIRVLRLNPRRRSEVLGEITDNIQTFQKLYSELNSLDSDKLKNYDLDEMTERLVNLLNKIGYDIDYLLSKENKTTCINNILLVVKTYESLLDFSETPENNREYIDFLRQIMRLKENEDYTMLF